VQIERADAAAEAVVARLRREADPEKAMEQILAWHTDQFETQLARGKFGSPQKAAEHARAILAIARELLPYKRPKLSAVAVQAQVEQQVVVRVPEICKTTEEWIEKYGRSGTEQQKVLEPPAPHVEAILDGVAQEEEKRKPAEMAQREAEFAAQNPDLTRSDEERRQAELAIRARIGEPFVH
jgi:hypothetical protein